MKTLARLITILLTIIFGISVSIEARPSETTTNSGVYEATFYVEETTEERAPPTVEIDFNNYLGCEYDNISRITEYHVRWVYLPNGTVIVDTTNPTLPIPRHIRFFDDYSLRIKGFMKEAEYFDYLCVIIGPKDPNEHSESEQLLFQPVFDENVKQQFERYINEDDGPVAESLRGKRSLIRETDEKNSAEENMFFYNIHQTNNLRGGKRSIVEHEEDTEELFPSIAVQTSEHKVSFIHCNPSNRSDMLNYNVRWLKNNHLLIDTSNPQLTPPRNIRLHNNYTLEITDLGNEENAIYSCQLLGMKNITELIFPQIDQSTIIRIPESGDVEVELMQEVILTCIAMTPKMPSITWYFKNRELSHTKGHKTILRFNATNKNQAGEYRCIVSGETEPDISASFFVRVFYKPEVTVDKTWVHSAIGERTELSCIVYANPRPQVDWYHEGEHINLTSRVYARAVNDKHTLTIKNTRIADFGNYTCQGTNFLGRTFGRVYISGLANRAKFKHEFETRTETTYTLVWEVDSYSPIIQYSLLFRKSDRNMFREWVKLIIPSTDNYNTGPIHMESYSLTGLMPSTIYEATVSSRNRFGWSQHSSIHKFATKNLDIPKYGTEEFVEPFPSSAKPQAKLDEESQYFTDEEALTQTDDGIVHYPTGSYLWFLVVLTPLAFFTSTLYY